MSGERPGRDVTVRGFFEAWLPGAFARAYGGARRPSGEVRVRVEVLGDGGGAWDLDVVGGALRVAEAGAAGRAPDVIVSQSLADFRAITVGEPGAVDLAPPAASALDLLFLDPRARQVLGVARGTVRFEVSNYNGRTWTVTTTFGGGAAPPKGTAPTATLTVDADTYGRILAGTLAPPEAYLAGKVRLAGDTSLAMQLAMALLPRFVRPG